MAEKIVTLLWGLPGSGKSTYAGEQCPPRTNKAYVIDCDTIWKYRSKGRSTADAVADEAIARMHYVDRIIIDGLITTNNVARDIFTAIATHHLGGKNWDIKFEIVWWTPDIEGCLHNDRGRRKVDSKITIQHSAFEEPSQELIQEWNVKKVTRKEVIRKPAWKVWAQENGLGGEERLKSDSWCLGGTAGNCWDNEKRQVSASPQPASFREFDELLEQLCPTITFLQYKKLYNETVSTDTSGDGDYYGGWVEYGYYVCDLPKLYEMLIEMGVISG